MTTNSSDEIVSLEELARRLSLSKTWLHREVVTGRILSLVAGKRRLFSPSAVQRSLAGRAASQGRESGGGS